MSTRLKTYCKDIENGTRTCLSQVRREWLEFERSCSQVNERFLLFILLMRPNQTIKNHKLIYQHPHVETHEIYNEDIKY